MTLQMLPNNCDPQFYLTEWCFTLDLPRREFPCRDLTQSDHGEGDVRLSSGMHPVAGVFPAISPVGMTIAAGPPKLIRGSPEPV
jgi:hypothetical protein